MPFQSAPRSFDTFITGLGGLVDLDSDMAINGRGGVGNTNDLRFDGAKDSRPIAAADHKKQG